jgi:hypothetical protein
MGFKARKRPGNTFAKRGKKMGSISKNYAKTFYEMFIISLILSLSPSKALGFTIPFIAIFWFIVRSRSGVSFKRFVLIHLAWVLILFFYNWYCQQIGFDFISSNAFISYLNYASIIFILAFPAAIISRTYDYEKYARILLYVILIEGCVGIMQRILVVGNKYSLYSDAVEGTINPFSFIVGHSGFGNQFFAINMVFLLIFCLPYVYSKKKTWILFYLTGFIALVLASVGHVFYSLLLAILVTYLIFEGWTLLLNIRMSVFLLAIVSGMLFTLAKLDPGVFNASQRQFEMFISGETPKAKAMEVVFNELVKEYPTTHLIGIGPAQYSSRAGTIASGTYYNLSTYFLSLPLLEMGMTAPFKKYVSIPWLHFQSNLETFGNSTMYRPFFSLLSVYVEFGGLTVLLLLFMIFYQIHLLKVKYRSLGSTASSKTVKLLALSCSTAILFLFFIGLYENYYETAQGIFTGILLILVMRALVRTKSDILQPSLPNASPVEQEMAIK